MEKPSAINQAAKQGSIEIFGYEEGDYTIPFGHGAKWAIGYCNQVIRKVLEHYEPCGVIDCIMADYEEIISAETDQRDRE